MENTNEKLKDYDFNEITKYIQSHEKKYPNANYTLELSDVKFSENDEEKLYWVVSSQKEKYVFPEWEDVKEFLETSTSLLLSNQEGLTIEETSGMIAE